MQQNCLVSNEHLGSPEVGPFRQSNSLRACLETLIHWNSGGIKGLEGDHGPPKNL